MTGKPISPRKPPWLKVALGRSQGYWATRSLLQKNRLNTVCESAACPNIGQCWQEGTATFMILGDVCTRRCAFCAVPTGRPEVVDSDEPQRLAQTALAMNLHHVVITSVDRDDLEDGGAGQFAACIHAIRHHCTDQYAPITIEVLTPDFRGKANALEQVFRAAPTVFNHNLETVPRLYSTVRPASSYPYSLALLHQAAQYNHDQPTAEKMHIKSGIMLGLGEEQAEIDQLLIDLRKAGVTLLTMGQYLQPSRNHHPVQRFLHPEEFADLKKTALALGFQRVESHPLARSSFHAEQLIQP